jgi:bacitracin synthase 3
MTIYKTGDLARWLPDGNIEFSGRIDQQVKLRGFRVEPGEIEVRLLSHEEVRDAVVTVREGKDGDRYLCAYITTGNREFGAGGDISTEMREYLAQMLPDYMIPTYFVRLDNMPLTSNGKVDRKALPVPEVTASRDYAAPANETEKKLAEIWAEILNIEHTSIGMNDNFFELGGHSLKATVMVSKIHKKLDVKLPLAEVFRTPTIKGVSAYIKGIAKDKYFDVETIEKKEYYPLSSAQKRLYTLHHMEIESTYYNCPMAMLLEGKLEREKMETVLRKLIERHESFRTSFEMIGNEPFQKICEEVDFEIDYYDNVPEKEELKIIEGFMKPFDLTRPPLLRVGLLQKSEDKHVFMIDMHHIITDGTSLIVFRKEFQALYAGEELPPLKFQYKDYSKWHTKLMASEEMKKQENYWLKQLEGEIPILDLPTDFPMPSVQNLDGDMIPFEIDGDLYEKIKRLAAKTGVTLYIVLLSIYTLLLSKLSEQEDIVVGTTIAGRTHSDLQNIVGFFINMLVMRNQPKGDKTYNEFLMEVKENAVRAYENQDYPFEALVEKLHFKRESGRHALIDAVILLHNQDEPLSEFGIYIEDKNGNEEYKLEIRDYESKLKKAPFTFCIDGVETGKKILMRLVYATGLFKRSTAVKLTELYIEILEQAAEHRETPLLLRDIEISGDFLAAESKIPTNMEFGF